MGSENFIYAGVADPAPINALHTALLAAFPELSPDAGSKVFTPHITVGRFADGRDFKRAWREISTRPCRRRFKAHSVVVAHCGEDGSWLLDYQVPLGGGLPN